MTSSTGGFNAVPASNPTAYLNQSEPSTVLRIIAQRAPTSNDRRQKLGTIWVDQTTDQSYQLTTVTAGSANWTLLGPGASDVDTLTGDSGGAISPSGGNITLAGGTNLTSVGAGSTITFNLDDAINVATSVTSGQVNADNLRLDGNTLSSTDTNGNINLSPDGTGVVVSSAMDINGGNIDGTIIGASTPAAGTFTTLSGTTSTTSPIFTNGSGNDFALQMGDAAGANVLNFTDSAAATVATMDSDGNMSALSFATTDAANGLTVQSNGISADGSNTNIDLTLTPKGTGNIDVASGDLDVQSGNVVLSSAATQLQMTGGAVTDFIGSATLSSGTVTVANTNIAATDHIFLSYQGSSLTNTGELSYTISAATSFTIESTNAADANTVSYFIVREL